MPIIFSPTKGSPLEGGVPEDNGLFQPVVDRKNSWRIQIRSYGSWSSIGIPGLTPA